MRTYRGVLILSLAAWGVAFTAGSRVDDGLLEVTAGHAAVGPAPPGGNARADTADAVLRSVADGPLEFEPNRGQDDHGVEYLARGPGYGLFLARDGVALVLAGPSPRSPGPRESTLATILRMRWVGAEPLLSPVGEQPLARRSHYVLGRDRSRWLYDVPHFASVRYPRLYPGVDLVVHGSGREPQYDFVVAPGADPARIRIAFSGTEGLRIDPTGDLVLQTAVGEVVHRAPFAFQVDARGFRRQIAARFAFRDNRSVGFALGEFDPSRQLVIDPKVHYATLLGTESKEVGFDVAEDGAGRIYVVGRSSYLSSDGVQKNDAFVTKIALCCGPAPNVMYTTHIGSQKGDEAAVGVTVFGQEAHVVGSTFSDDFPLTVNRSHFLVRDANHENRGKMDAFYVRLKPSGKVMTSTLLGGHGNDGARDVAVRDGFAYIVGTTDSANFPRHAANGVPGGNEAGIEGSCKKIAFLTKLDLATTGGIDSVVYSTYLPGANPGNEWSRQSMGAAVGVDASGNAYVAGMRRAGNAQNICSPNVLQNPIPAVWKIGPTGQLAFRTQFGGSYVTPYDMAVTSDGHAWVVGSVASKSPPPLITVNPIQPNNAGGEDAFITKINPQGGWSFSTYFGGRGDDRATGVALHPFHDVAYITGTTTSVDFPHKNEVSRTGEIFVMGLDSQGQLSFSTKYNGEHLGDIGPKIAVDKSGRAIVAGTTKKAGFAVTENALQSTMRGVQDAFLVILSPDRVLGVRQPRQARPSPKP